MYPLFFRPILKRIVWGGRRLGDLLGKPIGRGNDYAESWEVASHGDDQSVVQNGSLAGKTLQSLIGDRNRELLGRHAGLEHFPLLLKYLDCHRVLSVQVHPDDAYARRMPTPDLGKTEAWYVVDAQPGSLIYAGLKVGVDRQALQAAIREGRADQLLHAHQPQVGECIFIPAGTVHALGGGLVVAEIQQSSDATFRLFDWNRVGQDGRPRQLHVDEALQVADFQRGPIAAQVPAPRQDGIETLVECDKFVLSQARFDADHWPLTRNAQITIGGDDTMYVISVVRGAAELSDPEGAPQAVAMGRSVLIPAAAPPVSLRAVRPATTILIAHLP